MSGFDDYASSLQMRDLIQKMIQSEIAAQRPRYKYAQVKSIDRTNYKCTVVYVGDPATNAVTVKMGSIQPNAVGQVVRVEGKSPDKFITDIMGPAYKTPGLPDTVTITDWNAATTPGFYYGAASAANAPQANNASFGHVSNGAAGRLMQIVHTYSTNTGNFTEWQRTYSGSAWTAWALLPVDMVPWTAVTPAAGWTSNLRVRVTASGICIPDGNMQLTTGSLSNTGSINIGTLPVGAAPISLLRAFLYGYTQTTGTPAGAQIQISGGSRTISMTWNQAGSFNTLYFEGLSWPTV